jgi:hypothetical protein
LALRTMRPDPLRTVHHRPENRETPDMSGRLPGCTRA